MNRREIIAGAAALAACSRAEGQAPAPFPMRRGVNLGNALEAPNEGDWGYRIEPSHLDAIRDAGFDGVRLPVRWNTHASQSPPYTITPDFFARVDQVIFQALQRNLYVQLDSHHYDALIAAGPRSDHGRRLRSFWSQIARRYANSNDRTRRLIYEPFNEPSGASWNDDALTLFQAELVDAIREHDTGRMIVLGPGNWQNIDTLARWRPPEDHNIAVSVHYYEPHAFTHQNAEWLGADAPTFGRAWGTSEDRGQIRDHIARAAGWGEQHDYTMQLGEFGANPAVPIQQRAAWTRAVREACETNGIGWCVWDFAGAFPVWDQQTGAFIPLVRDALLA